MAKEEKRNKCWNELTGSVRIVVDAVNYNFENDRRPVIPFINGLKWGALNKKGEVLIWPKYDFVIIDSGLVRAGIIQSLDGYSPNMNTAPYYNYRVGIFNFAGDMILDINYQGVIISQDGKLLSVINKEGLYGVLNLKGDIIVPFGKYSYIDGFDKGFARVIKKNQADETLGSKWGIINEDGEETIPAIYDNIWKFYGKNRFSTRVEKDGKATMVYFQDLSPSLPALNCCSNFSDYSHHYGEYAGSYAQDVMEYSDEMINDAFDGDPDAYWNID